MVLQKYSKTLSCKLVILVISFNGRNQWEFVFRYALNLIHQYTGSCKDNSLISILFNLKSQQVSAWLCFRWSYFMIKNSDWLIEQAFNFYFITYKGCDVRFDV